jgi:hypothetical protein
LVEFAVADLDPKIFQEVLLARLDRLETGQANALDEALLSVHADLAARFGNMVDQLKRVLDRLPPGPAQRGDVAVYLRVLIDWLSTDPWPRRFDAPVLTPAMIERKLRVVSGNGANGGSHDADELTNRCRRLVILGGPGSGKTWLARRTARRCAEDALEALAAGRSLDEIDLPLYTTCSRLFSASGDIRLAVVSSALDQLGDLGGSRISAAVCAFFTERNLPTLLVIDSLDEARGAEERLRQADTLPWRIILTSRPNAWNDQLSIDGRNDYHRVSELRPLRYPDDVEPFIECWFTHRPQLGSNLVAQIAQRPDLQQAATVPLILTFYCIVGGSAALPKLRRDLYIKVLRRMLTGGWRGRHGNEADMRACLETLRTWAWSGASCDPTSGVGTWIDEFLVGRVALGTEGDAVDHVAGPIGPVDIDTEKTLRRFAHRSLREHLVAEHVASRSVHEAAEILLPHLWYDRDWEYSAPAALAMHPEHDRLLRELVCRAARTDQMPVDFSVIDAGGEFLRFLARIASESEEADWSPELAEMIGDARVKLARAGYIADVGGAAGWASWNRQARTALLARLARATDGSVVARVATGVVQLAPTRAEQIRTRETLVRLLASQSDGRVASAFVDCVLQFVPTMEDKQWARHAFLQLLAHPYSSFVAGQYVRAVVRLSLTTQEKRQSSEALLALLIGQRDDLTAWAVVNGVVELASSADDRRKAGDSLLELLDEGTPSHVADKLVFGVVQLLSTLEDRRHARAAMLALLGSETDGRKAAKLADGVIQLDPTPEDQRHARAALLALLVGEVDGWTAAKLADGVIQLDPTPEDQRHARAALLPLLASEANGVVAGTLVHAVIKLVGTPHEQHQVRVALLGILDCHTNAPVATAIATGVTELDLTAEDKRQARDKLLALLDRQTHGQIAGQLASGAFRLAATAEDERQSNNALFSWLAGRTEGLTADLIVDSMIQPDSISIGRHEHPQESNTTTLVIRHIEAFHLVFSVVDFAIRVQEQDQARHALLVLLDCQTDGFVASAIADGVLLLDPTAEDRRQVREALVAFLGCQSESSVVTKLANTLARYGPTINDLSCWRDWTAPPTAALLAAVRQNSTVNDWLSALPSLPHLPGLGV